MAMRSKGWLARVLVIAALTAGWGSAQAQEVPLVTGEHWSKSTEQLKKVYLIGLSNVLQVETAYHAAKPPADEQSFVPRFARGLKGQTLDSVRESLDRWYAAHPESLQRSVIETIWFEIVVPGLKTSK